MVVRGEVPKAKAKKEDKKKMCPHSRSLVSKMDAWLGGS